MRTKYQKFKHRRWCLTCGELDKEEDHPCNKFCSQVLNFRVKRQQVKHNITSSKLPAWRLIKKGMLWVWGYRSHIYPVISEVFPFDTPLHLKAIRTIPTTTTQSVIFLYFGIGQIFISGLSGNIGECTSYRTVWLCDELLHFPRKHSIIRNISVVLTLEVVQHNAGRNHTVSLVVTPT